MANRPNTKKEIVSVAKIVRTEMDRQFWKYRSFDDYVKRETKEASSKILAKTIAVAVIVVTGIGFWAWLGLPVLIKDRVDDEIKKQTSQEALLIISNHVSSVARTQAQGEVAKRAGDIAAGVQTEVWTNVTVVLEKANAEVAQFKNQLSVLRLITMSHAGDRLCYDELREIAASTNLWAKEAKIAVSEIENNYLIRRYSSNSYHPMLQKPGLRLTNEVFVDCILGDYEWNCDGAINELVATKDRSFVGILISPVEKSRRLETVYTAIAGINSLAQKQFRPLDIDSVISWWESEKENKMYHSAYEPFAELRFKIREGSIRTEQSILMAIDEAKRIIRDYPDFIPIRALMVLLVLDLPAERRMTEERKILCENSLSKLEQAQDRSDYYCIKTYYLDRAISREAARNFAKETLAKDPQYETVLKNSAFAASFFGEFCKDELVPWPSRVNEQATPKTSGAHEGVNSKDVRPFISLDGVVGFVNVVIKRGRRALIELPLGKSSLVNSNLLRDLNGCFDGDEISWSKGIEGCVYTRRNGSWIDRGGECADEIKVPVGETVIYYGRKVDAESQIAFSISM